MFFPPPGCTCSPSSAACIAAWRIWQNLNKLRQRKNDSWDARLIDQLRKRGSDPFKPHDVDFFLAFPTREAAEQLAAQLRAEGFDADVVDEPENGDLRYSLHAHKSMQLTVPDMQELSRRLTDAAEREGRALRRLVARSRCRGLRTSPIDALARSASDSPI